MTDRKVGLDCFLDVERPCNCACMAYLDDASIPQGEDYLAPDGTPRQWAHCSLLVDAHRSAKHLVHIAATAGQLVQLKKVEAADKAHVPPSV